eukprot:m.182579 g.182579  ORF g.182579 m.182579 type:complete len:459 (-) comp18464_c0_seq4:375-1751(-)
MTFISNSIRLCAVVLVMVVFAGSSDCTAAGFQQDSITSAQHFCTQKPNVIVFKHRFAAGLNHFKSYFEILSNVATTLCARVIPPSIQRSLHLKHNNGNPVDEAARWSHYFNFSYADDNSPVILDQNPTAVLREFSDHHSRNDTVVFLNTKSDGSKDACTCFVAALRAVARNQTFVWVFTSEPVDVWYKPPSFKRQCPNSSRNLMELVLVEDRFRQPITNSEVSKGQQFASTTCSCSHSNAKIPCRCSNQEYFSRVYRPQFLFVLRPPDIVRRVGDIVARNIAAQTPGIQDISGTYALHIRRGDTIQRCNTTVPEVVDYVRHCSCFRRDQPVRVCAAQHLPLVVWTDETDPGYLAALRGALLNANGGKLVSSIVHGDIIARRVVRAIQTAMGIGTAPVSSELRTVAREVLQAAGYIPGDNYFLFAVSRYVQTLSRKSRAWSGLHKCRQRYDAVNPGCAR